MHPDEIARAISGIKTGLAPERRNELMRILIEALERFVPIYPHVIRRLSYRLAASGFKRGSLSVPFWRFRARNVLVSCIEHPYHPIFQPDGPFFQIWCECENFITILDSRHLSEDLKAALKKVFEKFDRIDPWNYPNVWPKIIEWDEEEPILENPIKKPIQNRNRNWDFTSEEDQLLYLIDAVSL